LRLAELVIGGVIYSDAKEEFIQALTALDNVHQVTLMHKIDVFLQKDADAAEPLAGQGQSASS